MSLQTLKTFPAVTLAHQISSQLKTPMYVVGGAVRDSLLGFFNGQDFDFVLGNDWEQAAHLFAHRASGKIIPWDFNQIRVIIRERGQPVTADFALYRGKDIEDDLGSRDFTINSMAVSIENLFSSPNPLLLDPLHGKKDLQSKRIRACRCDAFDQDPLRILRAVRFARAFKFTIVQQTRTLLRQKASLLTRVAKERIKRELFSILNFPGAGDALRELIHLNILTTLIPELQSSISQDPTHQYDLIEYSLRTVSFLSEFIEKPQELFDGYTTHISDYFNSYVETGMITRRALLMFAGLLHDSCTLLTKTVETGRVRFLGHEKEGAGKTREIARLFSLGKKARRILATITEQHMWILQCAQHKTVTAQARRRLLKDIQDAPFEVLLLALADAHATAAVVSNQNAVKRVELVVFQLVQMLSADDKNQKHESLITGDDIKKILNIPESRKVGMIVKEIADGERNGKFSCREEVIEWLKKKRQ